MIVARVRPIPTNKSYQAKAFLSVKPFHAEKPLLIDQSSNVTIVTFNRPRALNAINLEMIEDLSRLYLSWENKSVNLPGAFIMKGHGKAFSAGGDIKFRSSSPGLAQTGHPDYLPAQATRINYQNICRSALSTIPQVSFWDGIVMGAGVGNSVFGKFKIATENSLFAMPESGIGLFPDAGSSAWMPHLKQGFGNYIGLTGGFLRGPDLIYSGIATHYVTSRNIKELEQQIIKVTTTDQEFSAKAINDLLNEFNEPLSDEQMSLSVLKTNEEIIRRSFSDPTTVEEIIEGLKLEKGKYENFAKQTLQALSKLSPTSLKIALESLKRGSKLDIKGCLEMEYRVFIRGIELPNFKEGYRAVLIDKDNKPNWIPNTLEEVSSESVNKYFEPLGAFELYMR